MHVDSEGLFTNKGPIMVKESDNLIWLRNKVKVD